MDQVERLAVCLIRLCLLLLINQNCIPPLGAQD